MKNILYIALVAVLFNSCQDDVALNEQFLQSQRDGVSWRSTNTKATINAAGALTLTASSDLEILTINTAGTNKAKYLLGTSNSLNFARFNSADNKLFTTALIGGVKPVEKFAIAYTGDTYAVATGVSTTTATGSGTGLKVDIIKVSRIGEIESLVINNPGSGYAAGDMVTVNNTVGGSLCHLLIQNINSNGVIEITDNANGTISGTFKINAANAINTEVVNFQYGQFYKIPVTRVP
jgi:hypothetical protein